MKFWAQQPKQIKVSEFSVSHIHTIEERVFLIHSILDKGYYCYENENVPNTINVYIPSDASDELSDFDFFFDNVLYDQLNEFHNLDKNTRGELFVQWRQGIDDEVYNVIYKDFTKGLREGGNSDCENALPFCTDEDFYEFPAGVNSGNLGGSGTQPYYCSGVTHQGQDNCLYTTPNPAFYYMKIDSPGDLDIYMYTEPARDLDFDCWGPFNDMSTACSQLSCSNMVDCSYSAASTEHCHIHNAQNGQYYVLLITNYSNQPCNIHFSNIETGGGTTDCSTLPPVVFNLGPYCVGETIRLYAYDTDGSRYRWRGPNGWQSAFQNPVRTNCTMNMAGTYTCTITKPNGDQFQFDTEVVIYANPSADFTADTVCLGDATQFTSTSTTNPSGHDISDFQWNFGDGQFGSGATTSHTYDNAGTYQVTLTVSTQGHCIDSITQEVVVSEDETGDYYTSVCENVLTAGFTWHGATFHDEGEQTITIPDATPQGCDSIVTLHVTKIPNLTGDYYTSACEDEFPITWHGVTFNAAGEQTITIHNATGCDSIVTLHVSISELEVHIEVEPNDSICEGETVVLHAVVENANTFVSVGDILCSDGSVVKPANWQSSMGAQGVVFYVDDTHLHGYAVSLTQSGSIAWSSNTNNNPTSHTNNHWRDAIKDFNGDGNTQSITNQGTAATYPAAWWTVNIGQRWYLPSAGQLNLLFGELIAVNTSFGLVGGVPINPGDDIFLWSSTEKSNSQAIVIGIADGWVGGNNKDEDEGLYVRAVIDF